MRKGDDELECHWPHIKSSDCGMKCAEVGLVATLLESSNETAQFPNIQSIFV